MAKESIIVRCYPSEEEINKTVKQYEPFGWELTESQRFQHGQDGFSIDGTNIYTTYHLLTFSREQTEDWYEEVTALETQYRETLAKRDALNAEKPTLRPSAFTPLELFALFAGAILGIVPLFIICICAACGVLIKYYWLFIPLGLIVICSTILAVSRIIAKKKKKNVQNLLAEWHTLHDSELEAMQKKTDEIAEKSAAIIQKKK